MKAVLTKKPRFSHHRGRVWDEIECLLGGEKTSFWFDRSWGTSYYVRIEWVWYRIPFWSKKPEQISLIPNAELFDHDELEIVTT